MVHADTAPLDDPGYRVMPHNEEAEKALLGALLVNNEVLGRVEHLLEPEHFFVTVHGRIYGACRQIVERGLVANPITLRTLFEKDEALTQGRRCRLSRSSRLGRRHDHQRQGLRQADPRSPRAPAAHPDRRGRGERRFRACGPRNGARPGGTGREGAVRSGRVRPARSRLPPSARDHDRDAENDGGPRSGATRPWWASRPGSPISTTCWAASTPRTSPSSRRDRPWARRRWRRTSPTMRRADTGPRPTTKAARDSSTARRSVSSRSRCRRNRS